MELPAPASLLRLDPCITKLREYEVLIMFLNLKSKIMVGNHTICKSSEPQLTDSKLPCYNIKVPMLSTYSTSKFLFRDEEREVGVPAKKTVGGGDDRPGVLSATDPVFSTPAPGVAQPPSHNLFITPKVLHTAIASYPA